MKLPSQRSKESVTATTQPRLSDDDGDSSGDVSPKDVDGSASSSCIIIAPPSYGQEKQQQQQQRQQPRWTTLHGEISNNNAPRIEALLASGADPNETDREGRKPIYYSCHECHTSPVTLSLLDMGRGCVTIWIGMPKKMF